MLRDTYCRRSQGQYSYRVNNNPLTISQFHFDDVSKDGRAPVQITPLPAEEIRREAQKTIDGAPSSVDFDYETACRGPPYHTSECQLEQEHGMPCIQDRLSEASTRLSGYRSRHWLKECLQNPERAQGRQFLVQGLLQKSFVYQHDNVSTIPRAMLGSIPDQVTGGCIAN